MPKRVAVLDVGSNSVRLMVADADGGVVEVRKRETVTTRLMAGLNGGRFTREVMERTARVMGELAQKARDEGAEELRAFGTSAMRDAVNRDEMRQMAFAACGAQIELISGEEEAALAYSGAAPTGQCGVIDIGGGSTELLLGDAGKISLARSARIGAVRMKCMNLSQDRASLLGAARSILLPEANLFTGAARTHWIGVGGTITTVAAMRRKVNKYDPGAIEGCELTRETVSEWLDRLLALNIEERKGLVGLTANRADIIHYGAAIFLAAMEIIGMRAVYASDHDNLEGYIRSRFS